jgi:ABC-type glycerol-3-phosphate transport system permease component
MDPQVMAFLNKITYSIGFTLLWMFSNSTLGIMLGYAFIQEHWRVSNSLFYIYLIGSFVAFMYGLYRLWKTPVKFDEY